MGGFYDSSLYRYLFFVLKIYFIEVIKKVLISLVLLTLTGGSGYNKVKLHKVIIERPVKPYSRSQVSEIKLRKSLEVEMAHSVKLLVSINKQDTILKHILLFYTEYLL